MQKPTDVLIFSHTHWDREWYRTFQEFRFALVEVIDQIITLVQNKEYDFFILDGQTIVLEDYLEIKPEKKAILKEKISQGEIVVGPWYILPDEFLVSAESLVRNLLIGKNLALEFGKCQNIGYLPDMFGHIAQMPQILKGFGIDKAVVWRGVNPKKNLFVWKGLDSSELLTAHLTEGYYNTFLINYENQKKDLEAHLEKLKNNTSDENLLLFPNGGDHLAPPSNIKEILNTVNSDFPAYNFENSTLETYFDKLEYKLENLEVISGELRDPEIAYILPAVFSARTYLKQFNFKIQNLITNWVEPLSVTNWLLTNDYNEGFVELIWKNLLKNQPHDSICGCSTDQVHKEMVNRYEETEQLCKKLLNKTMFSIAESLNLDKKAEYLVFFNVSSNAKNTLKQMDIDFIESEKVEFFKLEDELGNEVPYELISKNNVRKFISEIDVLPDWINVDRFKIELKVKDIKALGTKTIKILKNVAPTNKALSDVLTNEHSIENTFVKVFVKDGEIFGENLKVGELFNINSFYTSGDVGDEYNYSPPKEDFLRFAIIKEVSITKESNLSSTMKVEYDLDYYEKTDDNRQKHHSKKIITPIVSYITIKADDPVIYFKTEIDNKSQDHRLRVSFGILNNLPNSSKEQSRLFPISCFYDTHFALLEKSTETNKRPFDMEKRKERVEETFAIQNFADLSDTNAGLTLITNGIPEVEITDLRNEKELSLTLIRSVGWLSRDDLRTRGGGAGPAFETPEAQCLGKNAFEYSIYLHEKDFHSSDALNKVEQISKGINFLHYKPKKPYAKTITESLFAIEGNNVLISCIKRSESKDGVILRVYNPTVKEEAFSIKPAEEIGFSEVKKVRLDEVIERVFESKNRLIYGNIKPYEIISLFFKK